MALSFLNKPYPKAQSVVSPNIGLNALSSTTPNTLTKATSPGLLPITHNNKINPPIPHKQLPTQPTPVQPTPLQDFRKQYIQYDPSTDPIVAQTKQAGQANLDAGLMALQNLFGEQRRDVEGRIFKQGLSGSGIAEGIYGQQYSQEGQQTAQLGADVNASTQAALIDAMSSGYGNALKEAELILNKELEEGKISIEQYRADIEALGAETNRIGIIEERRRTAIQEIQALGLEGLDAEDYLVSNYPDLFGPGASYDVWNPGATQSSGLSAVDYASPTGGGNKPNTSRYTPTWDGKPTTPEGLVKRILSGKDDYKVTFGNRPAFQGPVGNRVPTQTTIDFMLDNGYAWYPSQTGLDSVGNRIPPSSAGQWVKVR